METINFVVWVYNENCILAGKCWYPERDSPILPIEFQDEETMIDCFGSHFPQGDVSCHIGTIDELQDRFF